MCSFGQNWTLCRCVWTFLYCSILEGCSVPSHQCSGLLAGLSFIGCSSPSPQGDCLCWGTVYTISLTCSGLVVRPTCVGAKFQPSKQIGRGESRLEAPNFLAKGPHLQGKPSCQLKACQLKALHYTSCNTAIFFRLSSLREAQDLTCSSLCAYVILIFIKGTKQILK